MRSLFLAVLLSLSAFAQHSAQPLKESTDDLRNGTMMFSIQNESENLLLWLERTPNIDYFLRLKKDGDTKLIKISAKDAKKIDREFVGKFIKCQYELGPSEEGCKVTLRLTMRGEEQNICGKDDKKAQEIIPLLKELEKRF